MNTFAKAAFAATVAVLMVPSAAAGNGPHRMSADYGRPQPTYELKVDGAPAAGQPLVVSLVNRTDGQVVRGGEVVAMRPVYLGQKASPSIQWVPVMLTRDANGSFVCAADHHVPGQRLTLRGEGPAGTSPVWLTLTVKS